MSSTYFDLVDERREVIQALLEMDCIPAGMEMFPAASDDQWTLIEEVINDCDYYIVIVGGRYGSLSKEGISYTEKEYDYALRTGKPILGFVHSNPAEIPAGKTEINDEAQEKLREFREKVQQKLVKFYHSPESLGSVVSRSLVTLFKRSPAEGWVRARHAVTHEMTEEISRLKAQVAELELELARSTQKIHEVEFDEGLQCGSDTFNITIVPASYMKNRKEQFDRQCTWDEILRIVGPSLMDECTEVEMKRRLIVEATGEPDARYSGWEIAATSFDQVKVQLRALQLIEKGIKKRTASDSAKYWRLTERGDVYLTRLLAIRQPEVIV